MERDNLLKPAWAPGCNSPEHHLTLFAIKNRDYEEIALSLYFFQRMAASRRVFMTNFIPYLADDFSSMESYQNPSLSTSFLLTTDMDECV